MPYKDPEAHKAHAARYYIDHREKLISSAVKWKADNPEKAKATDKRHKKSIKGKLSEYRRNAKKRGLEFTVTDIEFARLIMSPCKHCGGPGGGIDRIDSNKGYIPGNCQPCCATCNYMKQALPDTEFYAKMMQILRNQGFFDICPTPIKR
jgi:hypothetical protein